MTAFRICASPVGFIHAHDYVYRYYDVLRFGFVYLDFDDVLALQNATAIADFAIIFVRIPFTTEIVAQQIEGVAAEVPKNQPDVCLASSPTGRRRRTYLLASASHRSYCRVRDVPDRLFV